MVRKGCRVVIVARGGEGGMRSFKGVGISWLSGGLDGIRTKNLHMTLSRSLKDSFPLKFFDF